MATTHANAAFMSSLEERAIAESGMSYVVEVSVLPHMAIYRFGNALKPNYWYSGSWWFGKSVHDALLQYARGRNVSLRRAARVANRSGLGSPLNEIWECLKCKKHFHRITI